MIERKGASQDNRDPLTLPVQTGAGQLELVSRTLGGRLYLFLFMQRLGDAENFKASLDLTDTGLWLISVLGRNGPSTSLQLATALGKGKPQISRGTALLTRRGLIERESNRGLFSLTTQGRSTFAYLRRNAANRRKTIAQGLESEQRKLVIADVITITKTAQQLLSVEQNPGVDISRSEDKDLSFAIDLLDEDTLLSLFSTLSMLMKRIGVLRARRLGVSAFEAQLLARVCEAGETDQSELAGTGRDSGQISRTVSALIERKLLERGRTPGRRNVWVRPTTHGMDKYQAIAADCYELDRQLTAELSDERVRLFSDTLDLMMRNAQSLLARNVTL